MIMDFSRHRAFAPLILSREECLAILGEFGTPTHVIEHCKAVARTAVTIAKELNKKGHNLNIGLIESAALLHDMARVESNHDKVAAEYLCNKGYMEIADIVAVHMKYPEFNPIHRITETDVVCLGDRLCKENAYVGVEVRMAYILDKTKDDPVSVKVIEKKKRELLDYIKALETAIGTSLDELMSKE